MYPKVGSCKKPSNVKFTDKGKTPLLDVEIISRSIPPVVDQMYHFSIFACLLVLAVYTFTIHRLLYYETLDSTNLRHRLDHVEHLLNVNQQLSSIVESLKFEFKNIKAEHERLNRINDSHPRQRRSTNQSRNRNRRRKRNSCRNGTIETVAVQFRGRSSDLYESRPMEGALGPWFPNSEMKNIQFGATLVESDRKLEVCEAGLYFIYSQVTYLSKHTLNSYSINVISKSNITGKTTNRVAALCSTAGGNIETEISCYTSTISILQPKDIVYLQQNHRNRTILFQDNLTYFGLIRLAEL